MFLNKSTSKLKSKYFKNLNYKIYNKKTYVTITSPNNISKIEWPSEKVRSAYLNYFCRDNAHKFIKSSSVLPKKGSGTYFTNAGMNQFKSIILGEIEPNDIIDVTKYIGVANSQKCIRIGGKHNDLEDIGKDTYHHTFFEMLGNWSFGSYQNEKACELALNLLVNVYKLNINGLYFTYFCGDKNLGLEEDFKTKNIWLKLGIPESHVLPFDMKANFWEMDIVGPCGPCTEIHYDRDINSLTDQVKIKQARDLVNAGTERVIELWNLVFMNYNRTGPKNFSRLPLQVVDTGMGLERLTTVLNGLNSNYDTDLFVPLFDHIYLSSSKNIPHYKELNKDDLYLHTYRTLSDYMRSITVSISDGLMPSRNGLGGFLKFLILKSMKICRETLKLSNEADMICQMVPIVVNSLKNAYPELENRTLYIQKVIKDTDIKQKEKLINSKQTTDRYLKKLNSPNQLSGEQIWKLFKGDGKGDEISIDFIQNYCKEKNISLDLDAFDKILLADNEKSLRNMKNMRKDNSVFIELASQLNNSIPKTDNSFKYSFDLNSNTKKAIFKTEKGLEAKILSLAVKNKAGKYELMNQIKPNDECILVLDKTNFYPESGGQQSDQGKISKNGLSVIIDHVVHLKGFTFHVGKVVQSSGEVSFMSTSDSVLCEVDEKIRYDTTLNHTAVHLINHSIREHYKNENSILQTSSSVKNNSFKFEFKFNEILSKPTLDDLKEIEKICNNIIKKSMPVNVDVITEDENNRRSVRKLKDILYPRKLRVVNVGSENDSNDHSAELCCGTHVNNTSQLEKLLITSYNIVGDSSFEIEGCTGQKALEVELSDKKVLEYLKEMIDLSNHQIENKSKMTSYEVNFNLNQIADRSIQIENIFKTSATSYLTMQYIKNESVKYRPSKYELQNSLRKYFEEELGENSKKAFNSVLISSINPESNLSVKFMAFESILNYDQIISVLKKLSSTLHPILIIYNNYRNVYIFYTRDSTDKNAQIKNYFDTAQNKILNENKGSAILESNSNFRILKCKHIKKKFNYFSF